MRRPWILRLLPLVLLSAPPHAQEPRVPAAGDGAAVAGRLVAAALDGRSFELLEDLCRTAPGRLSGTAAYAAAVDWGLETMRELGLENVRAEKVMVPVWERGDVARCVRVDGGRVVEEFPILALGGSIATGPFERTDRGVRPEDVPEIRAEVLVVRSFGELEARADEARGKIVLFDRPMRRGLLNTFRAYGEAVPQRVSGAVEAARAGAVFALVRSMTTRRDDVPHTGTMRYADGVARIPTAAVSTNGADRIAELAEAGPVTLSLRMDCRSLPDVESANVVGEVRGRELPDEIVVVGGHLDAWDVGQGAHDDGAGCVHALEAARLLLEEDLRPRRTVRVVLFANEENGLRGGLGYEERHRAEMPLHVAALESDTGGFLPMGFTCSARGEGFEQLADAAEALDEYGVRSFLRGGGGADIGPMGKHGVVLFGMRTVSHRYFDLHHTRRDTIDQVNERELALGAAALAYMTWTVAEHGARGR